MTNKRPVPLPVRLVGACDDLDVLTRCHAAAWPEVHDPRRSARLDGVMVTGNTREHPMPSGDLDVAKVYVASQRRLSQASYELGRCGWPAVWAPGDLSRPVHMAALLQALVGVRAGVLWLQRDYVLEALPSKQPAHAVCDQLAAAVEDWPTGFHRPVDQPKPRVCIRRDCGRLLHDEDRGPSCSACRMADTRKRRKGAA